MHGSTGSAKLESGAPKNGNKRTLMAPRQCQCPHGGSNSGFPARTVNPTAPPPTIFARFGALWFFSFSSSEGQDSRSAIQLSRGCTVGVRGRLERNSKRSLAQMLVTWLVSADATLYRLWWWLFWKTVTFCEWNYLSCLLITKYHTFIENNFFFIC